MTMSFEPNQQDAHTAAFPRYAVENQKFVFAVCTLLGYLAVI